MLLQNVVFDYVEHKLYVLCVCGTREVRVDVCCPLVVDVDEELGDEVSSTDVVAFRSCVYVCVCVCVCVCVLDVCVCVGVRVCVH